MSLFKQQRPRSEAKAEQDIWVCRELGPYGGDACCYLSFFSLPEVKWLLTKPKEVPLNMKDTPTAPLFPEAGKKEKKQNVIQAGWSRGQKLR